MTSGERMFFFEILLCGSIFIPFECPGTSSHLEDIEPSKLGPLASLLKGWKVGSGLGESEVLRV